MGRGLGDVQRAVLARLQEVGKHQAVWDLLDHLEDRKLEAGTMSESETALYRAVVRAVHTLAKRGAVHEATVRGQIVYAGTDRRRTVRTLVCWLPGHPPPEYGNGRPVKPGDRCGEAYGKDRFQVSKLAADVVELLRGQPYGLAYCVLLERARHRCGSRHIGVPFRRALLRLEREGRVVLTRLEVRPGRPEIQAACLSVA